MKPVSEWSRDEKSMLLYLETCLVDGYGFVKGVKVNAEDIAIATRWNKEGFITFKRIPYDYIPIANRYGASKFEYLYYVRFTLEAWNIAHNLRYERSERMLIEHPTEEIESYRRTQ